MRVCIINLVVWLLLLIIPLAKGAEIIVEGGPSAQLGNKKEVEASLRMVTFKSGHIQTYIGEIERTIKKEFEIKDDKGVILGTIDVELPMRFGFFGVDALAETSGLFRIGAAFGMAVFDKIDKETDGTLWRFHISSWIAFQGVRLTAHHFSNGEDTPLKSKGPNNPLEFITLGIGINF